MRWHLWFPRSKNPLNDGIPTHMQIAGCSFVRVVGELKAPILLEQFIATVGGCN